MVWSVNNLRCGTAATRAGPSEVTRFRRLVFARLTPPACCCVTDFSDTAPTFLLRLQILQPQSECYPLGTGSAQIRCSIWPCPRNPQDMSRELWRKQVPIKSEKQQYAA